MNMGILVPLLLALPLDVEINAGRRAVFGDLLAINHVAGQSRHLVAGIGPLDIAFERVTHLVSDAAHGPQNRTPMLSDKDPPVGVPQKRLRPLATFGGADAP